MATMFNGKYGNSGWFWFIICSGVFISKPAFAIATITECTNAVGISFDVKSTKRSWHDEILSNTRVVLIRVGMREYNIVIKYNNKDEWIRAHDHGVVRVFEDESNLSILDYSPLGIVEVFQLSTSDDDKKLLIWSIYKNNAPPMKNTRISTYLLDCVDR